MRRREFLGLVASAVWPISGRSEERDRLPTLGVITWYSEEDSEGQVRFSALRDGLRKSGWIDGRNIRIAAHWAEGKQDRMQAYAAELVRMPADVIVANSTPLLSVLKSLTRTVPIVFTQVADPIGSGFVNSYARPGGNITGFTDFDASIGGKWVEVLKEAMPFINRVTVLLDPEQRNHPTFLQVIESAAPSFGVQVAAAGVRNRAGIEQAITALAGQSDHGLIVLSGPVTNTARDSIIELAARFRVPAIYPLKYYVKEGGLLYYGIDQVDQWPRAAGYVDRILRGEKPGDLPVQAPTKYELVINLNTAKALGLTVPPGLLARADEVIE